jgi:hypothetical protein
MRYLARASIRSTPPICGSKASSANRSMAEVVTRWPHRTAGDPSDHADRRLGLRIGGRGHHRHGAIEGGERILPTAIIEDVVESPLAPPVRRVHHAGIAKTRASNS